MVTYPDIIRSGYTEGGAVGPVAVAAEIKDETAGKMQSAINAEQAQTNAAQALTNQAQEQTNQANARDIKKALAWAAAGMVL